MTSAACATPLILGRHDDTGGYDNSIFEDVRHHARENYRGISYLLRMLFNDALPHFEDESIDLLHIDGLHTYEAVQEDFTNWYPKVTPGGIILFHDIEARQSDFGVWKFWSELEAQHETFAFRHGFGLGVLRKPGEGLRHRHTPFWNCCLTAPKANRANYASSTSITVNTWKRVTRPDACGQTPTRVVMAKIKGTKSHSRKRQPTSPFSGRQVLPQGTVLPGSFLCGPPIGIVVQRYRPARPVVGERSGRCP